MIVDYFIQMWDKVTPPSGLEGYHAAIRAMYVELQETSGVFDPNSEAALAMVAESEKLDPGVVRLLRQKGCAGQ